MQVLKKMESIKDLKQVIIKENYQIICKTIKKIKIMRMFKNKN